MYRVLSKVFILAVLFFSAVDVASAPPQISQSQLEMFKKLPKSQQEALARKYGVDVNTLLSSGSASQSQVDTPEYQPFTQELPTHESAGALFPEDEYYKPEDNVQTRYGSDFFQSELNNMMTAQVQSAPASYLLSAGDELSVVLYGEQNEEFALEVLPNGSIMVPGIGPLQVSGLTLEEVKKRVAQQAENKFIGVQTLVSLSKVQPVKVYVTGEVVKPGPYLLPPLSTISTAVSFAGGVSDVGSFRSISLKRQGEQVGKFDLYDLLLAGSNLGDITLKTGDVILVPTASKLVSVQGGVKREAIYELQEKESLVDAIAFAGGFSANAYTSSLKVSTYAGQGQRSVQNVDFSQKKNMLLNDGDEVYVPKKAKESKNSVYLIGAVARPGEYQWFNGMRLSDVLGELPSALLPNADINYALIVHTDSSGLKRVSQFSPRELHQSQADEQLNAGDRIVVFSNYELKSQELSQLRKKALTQDELRELGNRLRWSEYKQFKFEEYTDSSSDLGADIEQATLSNQNGEKKDVFVTNTYPIFIKSLQDEIKELQLEEQKRRIEAELAVFSRSKLLAPILNDLSNQGSGGKPALIVEVSGNVRFPGLYPIEEGALVADIIAAAGGLLEGSYLKQAEITRIDLADKIDVRNLTVPLDEALSEQGRSDYTLEGRDYINIFKAPNWQESQVIELVGEVLLPGKYTIRRGETLKSVIERAGGFTEYAAIDAAIFTRESLKEQEQKYLKDLSDSLRREVITNNLNASDSLLTSGAGGLNKLIDQLSETEAVGRLIIDIDSVMGNEINLVLEDKDTLYIPTERQSVNVIGEVYVATSHLHKQGLDIEDYINLSGGLKDKAAAEKVYVIKANGQVVVPNKGSWFAVSNDDGVIDAGDTIVVPLDSTYTDNLTLWSQVTQIIYQLGVAVAAIGSL